MPTLPTDEKNFLSFPFYGLIVSANENAEPVPNAFRSGSSREENKMLLPLPVFSRFANLPRGRGRKKPKRLREDAQLLGPFFQCNTGKRPLFVIPWPIGIARALPALYKIPARPGKRWQQQKGRGPCSCCARPLLSQWGTAGSASTTKERIHFR
ncbi:UNVERIFIED_CONTAM: hypothetical protein Sradi_7047900 [Sesamum radiatum]|uniref:Uncharacterized protein n=1 Tax=Sesamum radiatum TaxID=300843 RepID=A0AAW2JAD5_SESRA